MDYRGGVERSEVGSGHMTSHTKYNDILGEQMSL